MSDSVSVEPTALRLTYTIGEAASMLGIGRATAYESARRGEIKTIRMGRRLLVPRAALEAMLGNVILTGESSINGGRK